jgi:hypothetical protein
MFARDATKSILTAGCKLVKTEARTKGNFTIHDAF